MTQAQIAASRANGKKGGRKPGYSSRERRVRDRATTMGREALADVVQFWCDLVQGKIDGSTADRLRASENLADRFGLPKRTEHEIMGDDVAPKQFIFTETFVNTNGNGAS